MTETTSCGRIVLALDISPRSYAALELAAALAAELDAELTGLFVEDADLLHVGGLPFTREIGLFCPAPRPFDLRQLELALHREAEQARRLLIQAAARARLRWSFQVMRGRIASALFALAAGPDLVVLGKRPRVGVRPLRDTLVQRPARSAARGPVVAVYDGTPSGQRTLQLAAHLAHTREAELCLLLPAASDRAFVRLATAAAAQLQGGPACTRLPGDDIAGIAAAARHLDAGVLVLNGDDRLRGGAGFATLLNEVDCPVLLVG